MADSFAASLVIILNAAVMDKVIGASVVPLPYGLDLISTAWITVQQISAQELENLEGASGLQDSIMQVSCWSKNYEVANAVREAAKVAMRGSLGLDPVSNNTMDSFNHVVDADLYSDDKELYQAISRYHIWWERGA